MADFTDTITLSFAMNGRSQTFSYSATYADMNNAVRISNDAGYEGDTEIDFTDAVHLFAVNKSRGTALQVNLTEGADQMFPVYLHPGSMVDFHEGASGGHYGKDTANITSFLAATHITASSITLGEVACDILILNNAS